jgi:hypothetical protein
MFSKKCTVKGCDFMYDTNEEFRFHRLQHFNEGKDYCTACKVFRTNIYSHYKSEAHQKMICLKKYCFYSNLLLELVTENQEANMSVEFENLESMEGIFTFL